MSYANNDIQAVAEKLKKQFETLENKASILRAAELKALYGKIKDLPAEERARFGQQVNELREELQTMLDEHETESASAAVGAIDITAPFDVNTPVEDRPKLLSSDLGSIHPINQELEYIRDIFLRMGFSIFDSRQLDDEFNMFEALNFPEGHHARDDYDTFMTDEGLIPPAHTSTMQHRALKSKKPPIRVVIPGRTYRNEDVDATHGHTFHQVEGVYVDKDVSLSDMIGVLVAFFEAYFNESIEYKTQPFYFPFVEPGLEFLIKKPQALKKEGEADSWMEVLGCGMIHPNVLSMAGIDPKEYSGFAWGGGVERMIMLKYGIEDIRHFTSGKLSFMRKF